MDKIELLPCPFCGGLAAHYPRNRYRDDETWGCANQNCPVKPSAESITAWNTRDASQAQTIDRLERRVAELKASGDRLSLAAQTSGGTSGKDEMLVAAIDDWAKA